MASSEIRADSTILNGRIELICGCMFSGKTTELIRRTHMAQRAGRKTLILKHSFDARYHPSQLVSHDAATIPAIPVSSSGDIFFLASGVEFIAIDEIQFFSDDIIAACLALIKRKLHLVVAGLDMDYLGMPFGPMPGLTQIAHEVTLLHANCAVCGGAATHTFRKTNDTTLVLPGEKDLYEARCEPCFHNRRMVFS